MFVITRKIGESVYIGENIAVTVIEASGGRIRLGIEAPKDTLILREELRREPPAMEKGYQNEVD